MSEKKDNASDAKAESAPRIKRKLSEIPFRGWAVGNGTQKADVTPNKADIDRAVGLAKAGKLCACELIYRQLRKYLGQV